MTYDEALKVFRLTRGFSKETLTKTYRRFAFKYHPDRGGSDKEMQIINNAYDILKAGERVVKQTIYSSPTPNVKPVPRPKFEKGFRFKVSTGDIASITAINGFNTNINEWVYVIDQYPRPKYPLPESAIISALNYVPIPKFNINDVVKVDKHKDYYDERIGPIINSDYHGNMEGWYHTVRFDGNDEKEFSEYDLKIYTSSLNEELRFGRIKDSGYTSGFR